jgi:hypothetical protein
MTSPTRYNVGDKVVITEACIKTMVRSNGWCKSPNYPSDAFIEKARECVGIVGEVTHIFPPGYEVSVRFTVIGLGGVDLVQLFHMKDNWIELA